MIEMDIEPVKRKDVKFRRASKSKSINFSSPSTLHESQLATLTEDTITNSNDSFDSKQFEKEQELEYNDFSSKFKKLAVSRKPNEKSRSSPTQSERSLFNSSGFMKKNFNLNVNDEKRERSSSNTSYSNNNNFKTPSKKGNSSSQIPGSSNSDPQKDKKIPLISLKTSASIYETSPTILENSFQKFSPTLLKKRNSSAELFTPKSINFESGENISNNNHNTSNDSTNENSITESEKENKENNKNVSFSSSFIHNSEILSSNSNSITTHSSAPIIPSTATCTNCNKVIPFDSISYHSCGHTNSLKNLSKRFSMNRDLIGQFRTRKDK